MAPKLLLRIDVASRRRCGFCHSRFTALERMQLLSSVIILKTYFELSLIIVYVLSNQPISERYDTNAEIPAQYSDSSINIS